MNAAARSALRWACAALATATVVMSPCAAQSKVETRVESKARDIPPPSLILPGAVDPLDGSRASISLADLVIQLSPPSRAAPTALPPNAEDLARATRRYVEGRAALTDGKALIAAHALEEAIEADPTSRPIRTELARALSLAGNQQRAAQIYEDVLREFPDDTEALLALGLRASKQRNAESSIRYLGSLLLLEPATRQQFFASLRLGSEARVEIELSRALREVNADAATIEILSRTVARDEQDDSSKSPSEVYRALGDAQARRGNLAAALTTWMAAGTTTDVLDGSVFEPRIIWALLATDREGEAIGRLRSRVVGGEPSEIDVALASWLRPLVRDAAPLERWAGELRRSADAAPESARLAAALQANAARTTPSASDRRALRDEFARRAHGGDLTPVVRLAAELMASDPLATDRIIAALLRCGADAPQLLRAAQALGPGGAALEARLRVAVNDFGEAWKAASEALKSRPNDSAALYAAIEVAGRVAEPGFLEDLSRRAPAKDPLALIALARSWRGCDDSKRAAEVARRAAELAAGANPPDRATEAAALLVLAQAQADLAVRASDRRFAVDAIASARSAVSSDPLNEGAWRLLVGLLDALGAGSGDESTLQGEAKKARADALAALPSSGLARQLALEARVGDSGALDAIHCAIALAASDPSEPELLKLAVSALTRIGRAESAMALLDDRIADYPADALAWQLWTEAAIAAGRSDQAVDRILARAEPPTSDPIAVPLKELALRAAGRVADADVAAAERVSTLPPSARRSLESAAQALSRGNFEGAVNGLDAAAAALEGLPTREALAAAELSLRLRTPRDRSRLVRAFATAVLNASKKGTVEPALVARAAALFALESDPTGDHAGELRRMVEVAVAAASGGVGAGELPVWLAIGQSFADRRRPADGAAFLAALIRSEARVDASAAARLATARFALDAAEGGGAERSIAILDLERARGVRPFAREDRVEATDSDALVTLSGVYSIIGDRSGSVAILRESLRRNPSHAMSANDLAWDALERGKIDAETARLAELALTLEPDEKAILDTVGWLRYLQGKIADDGANAGAVTLLTRAVKGGADAPSPDSLDHLGDALWRSGDHDGATARWRQVVVTIEKEFPKEQVIQRLTSHERKQHGVVVADGEAFWKRNYGNTLDRAKKKIAQAERSEDPSVAPLASGR